MPDEAAWGPGGPTAAGPVPSGPAPSGPAPLGPAPDWKEHADALTWARPPEGLHVPDGRRGTWFPGGRLNVAANCADRHDPRRTAILWEGEPGDRRQLSYGWLRAETARVAAGLRRLGVGAGDVVALHLGWLPETVVTMLACARLGAVHALLPVPLPADALADRLGDLRPRVLFTQDAAWRHGAMLPLKARADEALAAAGGVEHTVVLRRTGVDVAWYAGDRWYTDLPDEADAAVPAVAVGADHPLLVVHLANRRGRPAGVVHGCGGLLAYAAALHDGLSGQPAGDAAGVFWCAADIAWLAGQSHGVYGPLARGATTVMFEGTLDTPTRNRAWEIIARYGVTALVTTPSIVRNLREWADSPPGEQVGSLRRIVTIGEAIEPDARQWLAAEVGRGQAQVADGWGVTELGGVVTLEPPTAPLPDAGLDIVHPAGRPARVGQEGRLVLRRPWPGTLLRLLGDDADRAGDYWPWPGVYATEDRARRAADGRIVLIGRTDPVISVSGQLVSATEVRDVLLDHPFVAAAEVVDRPDRRSGQAVAACVVLRDGAAADADVARELQAHVHATLGGLAQPRTVLFCEALPADVDRALLRRALWTLAAASSELVTTVSAAQLRAAVVAAAQAVC